MATDVAGPSLGPGLQCVPCKRHSSEMQVTYKSSLGNWHANYFLCGCRNNSLATLFFLFACKTYFAKINFPHKLTTAINLKNNEGCIGYNLYGAR